MEKSLKVFNSAVSACGSCGAGDCGPCGQDSGKKEKSLMSRRNLGRTALAAASVLAGLLGRAPASCPPQFLDGLSAKPDEVHKVTIGPTTLNLTLKDIIYDAPKGDFPHPNTMTAKLLAGNETLFEQEYYSVGGGFIEWKGYKPPEKGQPKYPFALARDLKKFLEDDKIPLWKVLLENEMAVSGKSEKQIWEFLDQVAEVMVRGVDTGLTVESVLPGSIKLHSKAAALYRNVMSSNKGPAGIAISRVAAMAMTANDMNAKYKETSEAGLAALVLC